MTSHQLEFDLQSRGEHAPRELRVAHSVRTNWSAWLAAVVLAQVVGLGLVPAIAEARRLSREEDRMYARQRADLEAQSELQLALRAQNDPIYREREKKLLRAPSNPLLARR